MHLDISQIPPFTEVLNHETLCENLKQPPVITSCYDLICWISMVLFKFPQGRSLNKWHDPGGMLKRSKKLGFPQKARRNWPPSGVAIQSPTAQVHSSIQPISASRFPGASSKVSFSWSFRWFPRLRAMAISRDTLALQNSVTSAAVIEALLNETEDVTVKSHHLIRIFVGTNTVTVNHKEAN